MAAEIADGSINNKALVRTCLERIREREEDVGAWVHLDEEQALAQAKVYDRKPVQGALYGIPVGIKNILDTQDMPTAYGSPFYEDHLPVWDSSCVALLRSAEAVILGKTVTTEFAWRKPGKTANPHHPRHTPGGSSSGSAAAVAQIAWFRLPSAARQAFCDPSCLILWSCRLQTDFRVTFRWRH